MDHETLIDYIGDLLTEEPWQPRIASDDHLHVYCAGECIRCGEPDPLKGPFVINVIDHDK